MGIGEAFHGAHGYDERRAPLSRGLIGEHGATWTGVQGDRPGCRRINQWDRGRRTGTWTPGDHSPQARPAPRRAWECFVLCREDPHDFARTLTIRLTGLAEA